MTTPLTRPMPFAAALLSAGLLSAAIPAAAQLVPAAIPAPVANAFTTMACPDGPAYQCSGASIIRVDNGIGLTSSGVQVYGRSTSDLANPNPNKSAPTGFALASGGVAEVRLARDANGALAAPALLLSNLGLSWDGKTERPQIVDTFGTTQGRTVLGPNGALTPAVLPPPTDQTFFDLAAKGPAAATQANYANNRYFPRPEPIRCPAGQVCQSTESAGLQYTPGDWRAGGEQPDTAQAVRLHSDGDARAGDPAGGLPFPGTKGYRVLTDWSRQFANLAAWVTQDTVQIAEWTAADEHSKLRRGMVAFGIVTDPAAIPTSGTATYSGVVYGWFAGNPAEEPTLFRAGSSMVVDFASRQVQVAVGGAAALTEAATPLPITINAFTGMGNAGTNVANYFTGPIDTGILQGGFSGRFFGPVVSTGAMGVGPSEIAGTFALTNATNGAVVVAGFIGRKL